MKLTSIASRLDVQVLPADQEQRVRLYAADVLNPETGEVFLVDNLHTLAGNGEAFLALELAGVFGQVLQVWPKDTDRPRPIQVRGYWVTLERPSIDPELGPVTQEVTKDLYVPVGFLPTGGGEIARIRIHMSSAMPEWTISNIHPMDKDAEEF